ncbi:MAG: DnaJ C-terminal domain-containing protein [Bacteriovorax sp.]
MTAKRDFYEVLGVSKEADEKQIKDAFRDLAMRYHPDRNKEAGAEERFKEIAEAYAVLSDPAKKRQYDLRGFEGVGEFTEEDLFGGINFDDIFRDFGFGPSGGFDFGPSLFDRLFGGRRRARENRGADMETFIEVPLAKIMSGGSESISLFITEKCSDCHGTGAAPGSKPITCDQCHGSGKTVTVNAEKDVMIKNITTCFKCRGSGVIIEKPCSKCHGLGEIKNKKTIEVSIPKGIEDGMVLRLAGLGLGPIGGKGSPGDLLVVVRTQRDSRFQRSGPDLWYSVTIPVYDAVLGAKIDVPTLKEKIIVEVPKGTQAQTSLRVSGKGLPRYGEQGFGDLYVLVNVNIPEELKPKEKKLYEELRSFALENKYNQKGAVYD